MFKFQFLEALLILEGDGNRFLRNVGIISPRDAVSDFRREEYRNLTFIWPCIIIYFYSKTN